MKIFDLFTDLTVFQYQVWYQRVQQLEHSNFSPDHSYQLRISQNSKEFLLSSSLLGHVKKILCEGKQRQDEHFIRWPQFFQRPKIYLSIFGEWIHRSAQVIQVLSLQINCKEKPRYVNPSYHNHHTFELTICSSYQLILISMQHLHREMLKFRNDQ